VLNAFCALRVAAVSKIAQAPRTNGYPTG
jgi:hypothetical protein